MNKHKENEAQKVLRETALFTLIGLLMIGFTAYMAARNFVEGDWLFGIVFVLLMVFNLHSMLRVRKSGFELIEVIEETDKWFEENIKENKDQ